MEPKKLKTINEKLKQGLRIYRRLFWRRWRHVKGKRDSSDVRISKFANYFSMWLGYDMAL